MRTVSSPQDSGPSPNPSPAGRGVVCEVTPIRLLTQFLGSFISHRTHRFNRTFWRTISIPQKASGIQNSQNVSAIVDTEQGVTGSLHPRHRGISVITPLPFGGGAGGGAAIFLPFVCSVLLCSSVRKRTLGSRVWSFIFHEGYFFLSQNTQI